jgi:excisionase family DNA binding protein
MIRHMDATLNEPLESVQKTAARLGVRRRKVYDLVASGDLPAYRIGGQIRISPQAIADWLARNQTGPVDGKP